MDIIPVPAFRDNYIWLAHDGRHALVVDPGDAAPVLDTLGRLGLQLGAILLTHHHADHVGGVARLLAHSRVPVFGPAGEAIDDVSHPVFEGDEIQVPAPALDEGDQRAALPLGERGAVTVVGDGDHHRRRGVGSDGS